MAALCRRGTCGHQRRAHPEDAARAVDAGADGVIVSTHGGRNLDGLPPRLMRCRGSWKLCAGAFP